MFNNSSISAVTVNHCSVSNFGAYTQHFKSTMFARQLKHMSKFFWSYRYRLITTVQQHENLQLIVALQVDQLWQHVVTHSSPVCLHQQTTV